MPARPVLIDLPTCALTQTVEFLETIGADETVGEPVEGLAVAEDLRAARDGWADDVEATMLAARALVGISAQSLAEVDDVVTPPQLRVLVMIASRGPLNLGAVARGLGVHPSNATRACDRLVAAGLGGRRRAPRHRREPCIDRPP